MDMEIVIATNASAYDQTPVGQQMNLFDAAKVMMTLKRARYMEDAEAKQSSPVESEGVATDRPVRKGSAKKGKFFRKSRSCIVSVKGVMLSHAA